MRSQLSSYYTLSEAAAADRIESTVGFYLSPTGTVSQVTGKLTNAAKTTGAGTAGSAVLAYFIQPLGQTLITSSNTISAWCWVQVDALPSLAAQGSRLLSITNGTDQFFAYVDLNGANGRFFVDGKAGATSLTAAEFTTLDISLATEYFVQMYYDGSTGTLGINVNNGTWVTSTQGASTPFTASGTDVLTVLSNGPAASAEQIRMDNLGFSDQLMTSANWDWLYNSDSGRLYAEYG